MPGTAPIGYWIGFHVFLVALLGVELAYSRLRGRAKAYSTAVAATSLWVAAALALALFFLRTFGSLPATQYLAGYAIEQSLSADNLFVFLLLFRTFKIEPTRQPRVLFWGVTTAIVLRGAFIAAGLGLLNRFHWISFLFALILLIAAIRLLFPSNRQSNHTPRWLTWLTRLHPVSLRQDRFFVREDNRPMITVLFLALIAIEVTDIVFALDSIPAVLSITRHSFLAYTSNIMAVMGLRSLYFLIAHLLTRLHLLHYGLAAILAFAACKMLAAPWIDIGPVLSLGIIVTILGVTITASLVAKEDSAAPSSG